MTAAGFDVFVMVDWSAAASPRTGADSIWIALRRASAESAELLENPPTRLDAMARLAEIFTVELAAGRRVLAGFDFPFGYPAGSAARMAPGEGEGECEAAGEDFSPPWRRIWRLLAERVTEGPRNANNRFEVAERLNREAFDGAGPFWGRPWRREMAHLPLKKPAGYGARYPAERRLVEARIATTQPVWKLNTAGSVGGQTLTGLAALERLRRRPALAERLRIWPFEADAPGAPLTIAEVYPSLFPQLTDHPVKDARQVLGAVAWMAERDADGALPALLAAPTRLPPALRAAVKDEEAWILGV